MGERLLLHLKDIKKRFGNVYALKGVDFELKKGEVHALLGSNGAGKSTLMKIISGAYQQDSGDILIEGNKVAMDTPQHSKEHGVSIVYQEFSLINDLSVAENIFIDNYPIKNKFLRSINFSEMVDKAKKILEDMDVDIDVRKMIHQLSVGEQQIVEIAKALNHQTKILILDEPTSALNSKEIDQLFKLVRVLKSKGVGIIYITHRLNELEQICDRVTIMRDGNNIGTFDIGEKTINEMVDLMLGQAKTALKKVDSKKIDAKPVLELKQLSTPKLTDISLTVAAGEIVGLAGQMGSGRTETLKTIFGLDFITNGKVFIEEQEVSNLSPIKMIEYGVGFVSEDRKIEGIFPGRSIKENIVISVMNQITKFHSIVKKKEDQTCREMIEITGLYPPLPERTIESLSGGNQQKAILGRWLALSNLKLLLLDEPTRGIDVGAKAQIYTLLSKIANEGVGILVASSDTEELVDICDKVYILENGSIKNVLQSPNITFNELSKEILGGTSSGKSRSSTTAG